MADIQHSAIADPQIHEPKGVAAAVANRVYVANGSGSGAWSKLQDGGIDSETALVGSFLEADGGGNALFTKRLYRYTPTIGVIGSIAANTTVEWAITVTGVVAATDEPLRVIKPTHQAGLIIGNVRIALDNEIIVQYCNITGAGIVPTNEAYIVYVWRR